MTRREILPVLIVFVGFAVFGTWRSPIPGNGEPHYLGKAKHFWDPDWCARDMFLRSRNAHTVFYATVGSLTQVLSLEQTAWVGRILVWGGLAFAWVRLTGQLLCGRWSPVSAAFVFLGIQATGSLSGEWLIGGLEARGIGHLAIILAIAAACRNLWWQAAVFAGLAISIHPVIGLWGAVALVAADFRRILFNLSHPGILATVIGPAAIGLVCSLPGLIPAVAIVAGQSSSDAARLANEIQVFQRLPHHLDPAAFPMSGYVLNSILLVLWVVLYRFSPRTPAFQFFNRFALATVIIAVAGFEVGLVWRSARLMKFYPFRLHDVYLPMVVSVTTLAALEQLRARIVPGDRSVKASLAELAAPILVAIAVQWSYLAPGREDNASQWKAEHWQSFCEACEWIEKNTPTASLFLTPRYNVGFKWFANRAEYVTWKDCPQDSAGLIEWKTRLNWLDQWNDRHASSVPSEAELTQIHLEMGIDYILVFEFGSRRASAIFQNQHFAVYPTVTDKSRSADDSR